MQILLLFSILSTVSSRGERGMYNGGFFCYRNALFQVMLRFPGLNFYECVRDRTLQQLHNKLCVVQQNLDKDDPEGTVAIAIGRTSYLNAVSVNNYIAGTRGNWASYARSSVQQDADEFFMKMNIELTQEVLYRHREPEFDFNA